jgi:outer membrane autotransporter protein
VAGHYQSLLFNEGRIAVGDRSVGAELSAGSVVLRDYETTATVVEGAVSAVNAGIIETGDDSVGLRLAAIQEDVPYSATFYVWYDDPPRFELVKVNGTADSIGTAYLANSGTIRVGASSTAVEIAGRAGGEQGLHLFNTGVIEAGLDGVALDINAGNDLGSYATNVGTISGDIVLGDGDDRLVNGRFVDRFGRVVSTGNLVMNGSTIDFGTGSNRFEHDHGVITIAGGENFITGADLFMTQARLDARNGVSGSRLTIDGNLSGSFTFGVDVSGVGADQLIITGNVADGSAMGIMLNPVEQLRGETEFAVITVGGENDAGAPVFAGVGGDFADSLLDAQARFDAATGRVLVTARFGMGHLATAAAATTTLAQGWWLQAIGSFSKRGMHRLAGADDTGISVWGSAFHEDGTITPRNDLQDTGFDQKLSGLQSGIEWTTKVGSGSLSVAPVFTYGDAQANLNANPGNARGDAWAYGLNASYVLGNGLYVDATWQDMTMQVDLRAPGTPSKATGQTDASGDGYNLEAGYAWSTKNGFTLAPQVQYASVNVDLDDFSSSDGVHEFTAAGGRYTLLRAGVSVFKTFDTGPGSVTPLAEIDYLDSLDSDSVLRSNGVGFASDTSGSGYRVEFGLAARYKSWDIVGRAGLTDTTASDQALSTNLTVRYRW